MLIHWGKNRNTKTYTPNAVLLFIPNITKHAWLLKLPIAIYSHGNLTSLLGESSEFSLTQKSNGNISEQTVEVAIQLFNLNKWSCKVGSFISVNNLLHDGDGTDGEKFDVITLLYGLYNLFTLSHWHMNVGRNGHTSLLLLILSFTEFVTKESCWYVLSLFFNLLRTHRLIIQTIYSVKKWIHLHSPHTNLFSLLLYCTRVSIEYLLVCMNSPCKVLVWFKNILIYFSWIIMEEILVISTEKWG